MIPFSAICGMLRLEGADECEKYDCGVCSACLHYTWVPIGGTWAFQHFPVPLCSVIKVPGAPGGAPGAPGAGVGPNGVFPGLVMPGSTPGSLPPGSLPPGSLPPGSLPPGFVFLNVRRATDAFACLLSDSLRC